MIKINETFKVKTLFLCDGIKKFEEKYQHDPLWRQTYIGCFVLGILQDLFNFNVTYMVDDYYKNKSRYSDTFATYPQVNDSIDIYVKPIELRKEFLELSYPIQDIFMWRFGFILRRQYHGLFQAFYSKPLNKAVWTCIYTMILTASLAFYLLGWWEARLIGGECSFYYELLFAFSAFCQHILPLQAVLCSRRIAYLSFILCTYLVHCFYTSNLLSHLVSDKDEILDLFSLANNDYDLALLQDMNLVTDKTKYENSMDKNLSIVWKKLQSVKMMKLPKALNAVMYKKTALLTDYVTLYPILIKNFDIDELCQLVEIDLYSDVKKYLFTSKHFLYKEEFKVGTLRAKEAGLIKRPINSELFSAIKCRQSVNHYKGQIEHTVVPIAILCGSYMLAIAILIIERIHYQRNRLWPYID